MAKDDMPKKKKENEKNARTRTKTMKYIRTQQDDIVRVLYAHSFHSTPCHRLPSLPCPSTSLLLLCFILAPRAPAVNLTVSRPIFIFCLLLRVQNAAHFLFCSFLFRSSSFSSSPHIFLCVAVLVGGCVCVCEFYFILINGQRAKAQRGLDGIRIVLSVPH